MTNGLPADSQLRKAFAKHHMNTWADRKSANYMTGNYRSKRRGPEIVFFLTIIHCSINNFVFFSHYNLPSNRNHFIHLELHVLFERYKTTQLITMPIIRICLKLFPSISILNQYTLVATRITRMVEHSDGDG